MGKLHAAIPQVIPRQFVDDINQAVTGEEGDVIKQSVAAGVLLKTLLAEKQLGLSAKSTVVASKPRIRKRVVNMLAAHGVKVNGVAEGPDLGTGATGGARRGKTTFAERHRKATRRACKARAFKRSGGKARKLALTNLAPVGNFGAGAFGCTKKPRERCRTHIAACIADKAGQCKTTVLQTSFPEQADLAVAIPLLILKSWADIWHSTPGKHEV